MLGQHRLVFVFLYIDLPIENANFRKYHSTLHGNKDPTTVRKITKIIVTSGANAQFLRTTILVLGLHYH